MIGVYQNPNEYVRSKTKVGKIVDVFKTSKLTLAGYIACVEDNRLTSEVTDQRQRIG